MLAKVAGAAQEKFQGIVEIERNRKGFGVFYGGKGGLIDTKIGIQVEAIGL